MRWLVRALYAATARLAVVASVIAPPNSGKAAIALRARRGIRGRYAAWAREHRDPSRSLLWVHAPSVGEGLQARPVLTLLRSQHPELQLAYTFFSPSAEEFSRTLDVDFRDYLPFDTGGDMRAALDALRPKALVFSKLDVWPELVRQAKARGVRVGMISATLGSASARTGVAASLLLGNAYQALDAVGAVDADDAARLVQLGVREAVVEVTGDTRFDQVIQRAEHVDRDSRLHTNLASERPTLVAGSTWPSDERHLLEGFARARSVVPALRLIIAPHEMTGAHLHAIEEWAGARELSFARVDMADADTDVLIVDRFGILGDLYALANVAFVGGGFHAAGLHSVLEPAAFGVPVLFGPRHDRSRDALMLLRVGGGAAVRSAADIERRLRDWFDKPEVRRDAGSNARAAVERGRGAAAASLKVVERLLA